MKYGEYVEINFENIKDGKWHKWPFDFMPENVSKITRVDIAFVTDGSLVIEKSIFAENVDWVDVSAFRVISDPVKANWPFVGSPLENERKNIDNRIAAIREIEADFSAHIEKLTQIHLGLLDITKKLSDVIVHTSTRDPDSKS